MNIVAPPVGALLLGLLPLQGVLAIDIVTALLGISPLFFIKVPQPPRKAEAAEAGTPWPSLWSEMGAGLAYVWAWPGMMILLGMASLINFTLNPASALLPILVTKHFGGGVMDLASLESVFGLGIVIGGVALGVWGGFRRRIFTSLAALVGIGVGFVLLGLAPANAFWLAVASSFLAAFMLPMANGPLMAVMQAVVAPEMQGRVFTLIGSVATAMSPLGLLIAGPIADALGIQAWYLVGGVTCLLMGVLAFFIPAITRLEDRLASPSVVVSETEVVPG
jgi:DHA3 family macrolide efflux protein-like MFS transporter